MHRITYKFIGLGIGLLAVFLSASMILLNNERQLISDGSSVYQPGISAMAVVSGDRISLYAVNQEKLDSIIKTTYSNLEWGKDTRSLINNDLSEFRNTGIYPGQQVEVIKSAISKDDSTLLMLSQGSTGMITGAMTKLIAVALPLILFISMLVNAQKVLPKVKGWIGSSVVFVAVFGIAWMTDFANKTNEDIAKQLYEKYKKTSLISNEQINSSHTG